MITTEKDTLINLEISEKMKDFEILTDKLSKTQLPEEKLAILIEFLEKTLSQAGSPHFKDFWEARKLCLDLFKHIQNPMLRSQLWNKYSELSKEARRLKEILDQESAFNVEQIETAIAAIENDLENFSIEQQPALSFNPPTTSLSHNFSFYEAHQKELNVLNAYASRINSLRKELIKIEMRIKQKNRFFSRLSELGDKVFPKRKELIDTISEQFKEDIDLFVKTHFENDQNESPFWLRDEIKGLQGAAKTLTLSTQVFKDTRLKLSECWDQLKEKEKEHKKVRQEQKEVHKANKLIFSTKLEELSSEVESKEKPLYEISKEIGYLVKDMRQTDLGRDEVKALREEIAQLDEKIAARETEEEQERLRLEKIKEQEKREKILNFKNKILELKTSCSAKNFDEISAEKDKLQAEINSSNLSRLEKLELEKDFKELKEVLTEKREERLLHLPENEKQALVQLKELLEERKNRRLDLKKELKKSTNFSGLDFQKALEASTQLAENKEKLEKLNVGIQEIEEKISELEKR